MVLSSDINSGTRQLAACGSDIIGLRDAALISLACNAGLRVSELVGATVADLRQVGDGSGRLPIAHSKTDQLGEGALAWLSADTMTRLSVWLLASGTTEGITALSTHSLKVGLTQDLFASGEDAGTIAQSFRWTSTSTALRYGRKLAHRPMQRGGCRDHCESDDLGQTNRACT